MAMSDFSTVQRDFEAKCKATAKKLIALIDKRLASIRRTIPDAMYGDAMGTSFFYVEGTRDNQHDPMYLATEYVKGERKPETEEHYGEPLPEYLVKANQVFERHATEMSEILQIAEYMYDQVGYTYS